MPYVTTKEMLAAAREGGYAVPAFNVENLEMLRGALEAAEQARSPVILQAGWKTLEFFGMEAFVAAVRAACEKAAIPAALHLDHGGSFSIAMRGFRMGFSSVMFDGSKLSYEENVAQTALVVRACEAGGVPVEGELGSVGGKEDDHKADAAYTDPGQAADYVQRTGVASLAVAIGTAHGVYKSAPKLDVLRLEAIRGEVGVPLVLHGSSGLSDEDVRACVQKGICKVNFATELRQAFSSATAQYLGAHPGEFDLRLYLAPAIAAVRDLCLHRIRVCGSEGKA